MPPTCLKWRSHQGQALVEMLVLLPVLLLLLLAVSDMGKLAAVSGKCEIAARYITLRISRDEPFQRIGLSGAAAEAERIFFQDTLDDEQEEGSEPQDVRVTALPVSYSMEGISDPFWQDVFPRLWLMGLRPIRGKQVSFAYDLIYFPYRKWRLLPEPEGGSGAGEWVSPIAAAYSARGNFVVQSDAFSGTSGQVFLVALLGSEGVIPFAWTTSNFLLILYLLGIFFP